MNLPDYYVTKGETMSWSITLSGTKESVAIELQEARDEMQRALNLVHHSTSHYVSVGVHGFISHEDNNRRTISNGHSITELNPPTGVN